MIILGTPEKSIELKILGYSFPENKCGNIYDLNSLDVLVRVNTIYINYEITHACSIMAQELKKLLDNLYELDGGRIERYSTEFIDDFFQLDFHRCGKIVSVIFTHQFCRCNDVWETYKSEFSIPQREFGEFIRRFKFDISRFPIRI